MGTRAEVVVRRAPTDSNDNCINDAFQIMRDLEHKLSLYEQTSELSRINSSPIRSDLLASHDILLLLAASAKVNSASGGAFDPTIAPAMALWNKSSVLPPSPDEMEKIKSLVGFNRIKFDSVAKMLSLPPGTTLDFNGIAKGYAAGLALESLEQCGVEAALVDIGGDIACYSNKAETWKVGINAPGGRYSDSFMKIELRNGAVATSGGVRRYWQSNGVRYPQILDPRTLMPPNEPLLSATVYSENAAYADAWATAAFVLGSKAIELGGDDVPAILIVKPDGSVAVNARWRSLFGPPASP